VAVPLRERSRISASGAEEQLNAGQVRERYPAFSPDGRYIAFTDNRLGDQEVWILDLKTRAQERLRLPRSDLGANLPFWSPEGRRLAVTRFAPDGNASLWVAVVDGSGAEEVVPAKPVLRGGPFSPDGRTLLYAYRKGAFFQLFTLTCLISPFPVPPLSGPRVNQALARAAEGKPKGCSGTPGERSGIELGR
jgi:dipeptidyl aminopeptidase/acylaminoacyl peptidase